MVNETIQLKQAIPVGRYLVCGCWGMGFRVWLGYEDQDQDQGYGICMDCQSDAEAREREATEEAISLISAGLNEKNRAVFDSYTYEQKKAVVLKAIDDRVLVFKIGK